MVDVGLPVSILAYNDVHMLIYISNGLIFVTLEVLQDDLGDLDL